MKAIEQKHLKTVRNIHKIKLIHNALRWKMLLYAPIKVYGNEIEVNEKLKVSNLSLHVLQNSFSLKCVNIFI